MAKAVGAATAALCTSPVGPRKNPLFHAFVEAGRQAGFELTDDYNGEKQEGFGPMEQTVWQEQRWSAANAYLKPALKRSNLSLHRGFAERIVFEGRRAVGCSSSARPPADLARQA